MRWKLFFQFKNSKGEWFVTNREDVKEINLLPIVLIMFIFILIFFFIGLSPFFR